MEQRGWKRDLARYLPRALHARLLQMDAHAADTLEEIRIRVNRPIQLVGSDFDRLMDGGCMAAADCEALMEALCQHSAYAFERERSEGYFTLPGGYRVGVCGRAGTGKSMGGVSSFNIRIAREWPGCAQPVIPCLTENGRPVSALLLSAPGVGKTTMLRDIARCVSDGEGCPAQKVAVVDERGEIAGGYLGVPILNVGARTDVLDGYPKARAMQMLIRAMSPTLIVTDEIGGIEDANAIREAIRCGVAVVASAHAEGRRDALARRDLGALVEDGIFPRVIELSRAQNRVCCRLA